MARVTEKPQVGIWYPHVFHTLRSISFRRQQCARDLADGLAWYHRLGERCVLAPKRRWRRLKNVFKTGHPLNPLVLNVLMLTVLGF